MDITLAQPRGFCAGVIRAIEIVERVLEIHGSPVYVLHEIVHNRHVVEDLEARGAVFVESLEDVPEGSVTIFSAHGVARDVVERARARNLDVIDATCPLVTKVHKQAQRYHGDDYDVVIVGHAGHPEVEGTRGQIAGRAHVVGDLDDIAQLEIRDPSRVAYVTQTTLSIDDTRDLIEALKQRYPAIQGPELSDICYATQNRQSAVRAMSDRVDLLLVVGARNSSNSNRLREVGEKSGIVSHLIHSAEDLDPAWFAARPRVGITAGASAPERLVQDVVENLRQYDLRNVVEMDGEPESTVFSLPASIL